jgi:DNA-binding SARP family transcriptional activator
LKQYLRSYINNLQKTAGCTPQPHLSGLCDELTVAKKLEDLGDAEKFLFAANKIVDTSNKLSFKRLTFVLHHSSKKLKITYWQQA